MVLLDRGCNYIGSGICGIIRKKLAAADVCISRCLHRETANFPLSSCI